MAVPKHKISKSRRGNRRSHDALRTPNLAACPQCTEPKPPHRICPQCGTYRGKDFTEKGDIS
jgi:large subunit ribosomal protein L32